MNPIARSVIYLGFNDPRQHVRGTENVIKVQAAATTGRTYYVFRGERAEAFRWGNFVAVAVPRNYFLAFFCLRRLIARVGRRCGQPIVHGHSYLLSAIVSGAPLVFTVHDALAYSKREGGSRFLWVFKAIECWVYGRAKRIHSISRYTWSQATAGRRYESKVVMIFNAISSTIQDCLGRYPLAASADRHILVVRSIEQRANLELILDLAERMAPEQPGTPIKIAGKGPLLKHYRERAVARGLSNVAFLGYVSDAELDKLYCRAECVVLPALYGEGFGLPLIEAYARGIPAVGSNVCAVPEVIARPELLFENTVDSLLAALAAARQIPRMEFLEHVRRNFDLSQILDQYRRFYAAM